MDMCGQQKAVCAALKCERVDMICMLVEKGSLLSIGCIPELSSPWLAVYHLIFFYLFFFPSSTRLFPHLLALGWVIIKYKVMLSLGFCFQSLVFVDVVRSANRTQYTIENCVTSVNSASTWYQILYEVNYTLWLVYPEGTVNNGLLELLYING